MITALGYDSDDLPIEEAISEAVNLTLALSAIGTTSAMPVSTVLTDLLKMIALGKQDFLVPPFLPWVHIKSAELVVLGAAPSVGKTATAMAWADEWSKSTRVAYFEYEMTELDLTARLVTKYSGVTIEDMENGLTDTQKAAVEHAVKEIRTRNLYVEACAGADITTLLGKIRKEAQRGTKVVFIDHLGLIPFNVPKGLNHAKAVGMEVTNKLKRLALELGIVIVLLSQLRREGYSGSSFPTMRDLRDSGEIEADADKVLLLWREPTKEEDSRTHANIRQQLGLEVYDDSFKVIHIGVVKYRNGALGNKYLRFFGSQMDYREVNETVFALSTPKQGELLDASTNQQADGA